MESDKPHLNELPTLTHCTASMQRSRKKKPYKNPVEIPNGIGIMDVLIFLQKITKDKKKRTCALNELSRRHLTGGVVSADTASSSCIPLASSGVLTKVAPLVIVVKKAVT